MSVALQKALDAIAAFPAPDEASQVIAAKCRGLMVGYDARWRETGWQTVSVEQVWHLPVVNPETGAKSRTFTQAGKFDGLVEFGGRRYLMEHKTTSEDIADPNATYWRRLAIDSQVSAYALANWQQGQKVDGTLYDVIRKPGIRPKNLAKADRQYIVSNGEYFGFDVPMELRTKVAATQDRECAELYAMRLARECINEPEKYFARKMIPRLDSEITEYAGELWDMGQSILDARNKNAHYRNSDSCIQYGTPCVYLGICSGHDSPDSDKWEHTEHVHAELPVLADANNVLTNSRIKCFQSCRRRAYFRYELGLRRRDDEESEALVLGTLFHEALANWWCAFMKGNANGNANAACGNEPRADTAAETQLAGRDADER